MRNAIPVISAALLLGTLSGCAVHLHFDLLGEDTLQEVVLQQSEAREKILLLDIEGVLVSGSEPGSLSRERDLLSSVFAKLERAAQDPDQHLGPSPGRTADGRRTGLVTPVGPSEKRILLSLASSGRRAIGQAHRSNPPSGRRR